MPGLPQQTDRGPAVALRVPPAGAARDVVRAAVVGTGPVAVATVPAPAALPPARLPAPTEPTAPPATGRRSRELGREAAGFAAVGALGLLVDIGGYNVLVHLTGWLADQPLLAKTLSLVAGTTVAYFGNRYWTYRHRPRGRFAREYALYLALSGVALGIALGCLAFSRYVLGQAGPVADNIAANGVGLALGSIFRFLSYRRFVFPPATNSA